MIGGEIMEIRKGLREVEFTLCGRDGNRAAHEAAKLAACDGMSAAARRSAGSYGDGVDYRARAPRALDFFV